MRDGSIGCRLRNPWVVLSVELGFWFRWNGKGFRFVFETLNG